MRTNRMVFESHLPAVPFFLLSVLSLSFPPLSLSFLRQLQDETLCLSTLAPWAARYSNKDITIEGHVIPAATPIIQALGVGLKSHVSWDNVEK